ncbi:LysE family translocator [Verminephrobacter aporrectodeae subsp. tuberculatae]|uniref:LysE family translocator n=1 Tax=Verminephrobacter aporrectodeae TaxID=1110389 RepID=UPI0002375AA8|nr:LysE family transporter [Verminephrobacter aporrectodeae]MCW5219737.1 LysE family translocator [Verminephrobacter aporrectodeae subsp. tuberculatae]MCW5258562.1 LysE family translocator [Verminephrobacter aporrectodeae subsp. tuberculatae]MCW5287565.1 LysE family translocator [Verminephrobacter aporrectodeae subsp. tuberculatae]MCW8198114.1 LysE family translocator [Verminephrobacter aporrectodeae subsp. tuberculatae]
MQTSYWAEFTGLALVHFLAVIAPGPDFAVTIHQSLRFGRAVGMVTALGIGAGISLHVGYTLLGVGALLHTYPWLLTLTSLMGAAYLAYLGLSLVRSQAHDFSADSLNLNPADTGEAPPLRRAFLLGFLTNATNPKATLFFLAIFTTLVRPTTPLLVQGAYGLWMCSVNAAWFMLVAALFTVNGIRVAFLRIGPWIERVMGVILMLLALRLVWQVFA